MKPITVSLLVASLVLLASTARGAETRVTFERNAGPEATAAFKFKDVPAPSRTDAGGAAKFSVVAGDLDPNGGGLEVLGDGRLPESEDDPSACIFFRAGSDGGRIVADLGEAVEVRRVSSYSWHRDVRGPQVYRLYGSDGAAPGFDPRPGGAVDPEKAGWTPIASVDTRPKEGAPGGQYGVAIAREGEAPLGKFRYLLLDVRRTADDRFGHTFFGEIDIDDGVERPAAPAKEPGGYDIAIDFSEMPQLSDWVEKKLRPTLEKWYPIIVESLPSEGYSPPRRMTVTFRKDMRGVAATSGRRVSCAGAWFSRNLEGEAVGAVVHELVHVAQGYRGRNNPGWLVEGVADYIRWFMFEPEDKRPRPNPDRAKYTDSYRTTAAFLYYLVEKRDKDIVKKFNIAMRQGKYSPDLWKEYTGKTVDDLWAEYIETLRAGRAKESRRF